MTEEFVLSEKIGFYESGPFGAHAILEEDVKEFIRLLKEHKVGHTIQIDEDDFDLLAGEKLIK